MDSMPRSILRILLKVTDGSIFGMFRKNIEGLIGRRVVRIVSAQNLDSTFTYAPDAKDDLPIFSTGMIGQYAHGNQPSHHVIYLFNAVSSLGRHRNILLK